MDKYPVSPVIEGVNLRQTLGLVTEEALANALRVTEDTLKAWRKDKVGPAFVKLGRSIYYRQQDIVAWVEQSVQPTGHQSTRTHTPPTEVAA